MIVGVPGSGKTWVASQLKDKYEVVRPLVSETAIEKANEASRPLLIEAPFNAFTMKEDLEAEGFDVRVACIVEKPEVLSLRYLRREGETLPKGHLLRMKALAERVSDFSGTSAQVLEFLKKPGAKKEKAHYPDPAKWAHVNPLLEQALKYASVGWHVVPDYTVNAGGTCTCSDPECRAPGKHPMIDRESPDADFRRTGSKSQNKIIEWWNRWPTANVAIVCGAESNLVAIDVDDRNGGLETLADLERKHGTLRDTVQSNTGGGGLHLLFAHPQGEPVRNRIGLFPGVDVKADGGRIVAPPSKHASGGTYQWAKGKGPGETEVRPLPDFLLDAIQNLKGTGTRSALGLR